MSEITKYRQSEEAAWNLLDAERQATNRLREQVAAQAAVIEKLRDALKESMEWNWLDDDTENIPTRESIFKTLSSTTDSTQILDEVRRAEREKCAERAEAYAYMSQDFNALAEEIRAME